MARTKGPTCHTCRRSRLIYDGRKPDCQRCCVRGVACMGYGLKPLVWLEPREKTQQTLPVTNGDAKSQKKGRPPLVLMRPTQASSKPMQPIERWYSRHDQYTTQRDNTGRALLPVPGGILYPAGYQSQMLILNAIHTVCPTDL